MSNNQRDDVDRFFDYDVHIPTRTIYMGGAKGDEDMDTDAAMAERIIKALHMMDQKEGDIFIVMNNSGGDIVQGNAIYDAILERKNHVKIKVYGAAMSAGTVILQAADKRVLAPNSLFMLHYGSWSLPEDNALNNERWADYFKKEKEVLEDIYLEKIREKHPKFTRAKLRKMLEFDTILTPPEVVELGLADEIEP